MMTSKFTFQFLLGKYLIEFMLQNFKNKVSLAHSVVYIFFNRHSFQLCNYSAYVIAAFAVVTCMYVFIEVVPPGAPRITACERGAILFAIDVIIFETITGYVLTYIACANKLRVPTEVPKENKGVLGTTLGALGSVGSAGTGLVLGKKKKGGKMVL
jgi:ligand-binding sensor protein